MIDRRLHRLAIVLAVLGAGIAAYLTWVHYQHETPLCVAGGGGCERVQDSDYAELGGIPVPVIGLAGYLTILLTLSLKSDAARFAGAFLGLVGSGFSIYLTYLELFVIEAICQWCVASAIVMTLLTVVLVMRAARGPDERDAPVVALEP